MKDQLGSPERIREKRKMIRKQPKAATVATCTEHGGVGVELQESQEREMTLQARITTLSQRAAAAEERATTAEERATTAEERATTRTCIETYTHTHTPCCISPSLPKPFNEPGTAGSVCVAL